MDSYWRTKAYWGEVAKQIERGEALRYRQFVVKARRGRPQKAEKWANPQEPDFEADNGRD